MQLIDSHCHIQSAGISKSGDHTHELWLKSGFQGDEIVNRAMQAGVLQLICVGCDIEDSRLAVKFCQGLKECYATVGIHPHEAKRYVKQKEAKRQFAQLLSAPKVVAIGECGLDYFYTHSEPEDQAAILQFQLDLAVRHNLPVTFHVRNAFADFWPIFDTYGGKIKGVLHSFTDSLATLDQALARGLYIGVNGIATFAKETKQLDMYRQIPLASLLLETDAPYLTPNPYRGTINEPKHIRTIVEFLAELRGEGQQKIAEASTANARLLFGL